MNLSKSFGTDQHVQAADGRFHHPIERTAQTIGAGAGAGAAVGAMTHSQNGVLIGALIGGAGGLLIDEILKHREETAERANRDATPEPAPESAQCPPRIQGAGSRVRSGNRTEFGTGLLAFVPLP